MNKRESEGDGKEKQKYWNFGKLSEKLEVELDREFERGKERGGETAKEKRRQAAAGNQNIKGERLKEKNGETNEDKHHLNQRAWEKLSILLGYSKCPVKNEFHSGACKIAEWPLPQNVEKNSD